MAHTSPTAHTGRTHTATLAQGPFSFLGWAPFVFCLAYLPVAHLMVFMLLDAGLGLAWSVASVAVLFPALLLPTVPRASARALVRNTGWVRGLFSALPIASAVVVLQIAMLSDGLSTQGLLAVCATAVSAIFCAMLMAFDTSAMDPADD
jgi:hypothetical protein